MLKHVQHDGRGAKKLLDVARVTDPTTARIDAWLAHVGWRKLRGPGDWRSLVLTLLLVFVTLVYVVPLRGMAASVAAYISGSGEAARMSLGALFTIYGFGFTAMSVIAALLYRDALRNPALDARQRHEALGQV